MAVDSPVKRASIFTIGAPYIGPTVIADGTIGQPDRQVIAYSYSGIAAGGAPPAPDLPAGSLALMGVGV